MAAKILLIDMPPASMDRQIASKAGSLVAMTPPTGMGFKIELEVDSKIEKEVAKDPLVQQKMHDAVKAAYDDLVDRIGTNLRNTDKGAVILRNNNDTEKLKKLIDVVNKGISGARDVAQARAEKDCLKIWADLVKARQEYAKYKVKIVAKITLAAAGVIVSIGLLAGGVVSFGAASIPGIVSMMKSVAVIGAEAKSACEEIEASQKRLDKNLREIERKFVSAKGELTKKGKAQEVAVTLAAQLFGATGPFALVPNIKESAAALDVVRSKLGGLNVRSHDAAKDLNSILLAMEVAKKKFLDDVAKKLAKAPGPRAKADLKTIQDRLDAQLMPFTTKVQAALQAVISFEARFKSAEPKVKFAEKRVNDLIKLKGVGWKIFENTILFTDVALSFTDPSQYAKLADTLANLLPVAGSLAADRITKVVLDGTLLD